RAGRHLYSSNESLLKKCPSYRESNAHKKDSRKEKNPVRIVINFSEKDKKCKKTQKNLQKNEKK
ncbi:MAG: hypothetical protein IJD13_02650, partial [Oscillospiraceae bacterium]|nr:hypothetical protein [Oscillospiraceae bacterium]